MENKNLEFVDTIILPEFIGDISYEAAFSHAGITVSRLFKTMFFNGRINKLPTVLVDCHRAVGNIEVSELKNMFIPSSQALAPADVWRLSQYRNSEQEAIFNARGACNTVLIANGSEIIWRAQIFNSRHVGWKLDMYRETQIIYGELLFSRHI